MIVETAKLSIVEQQVVAELVVVLVVVPVGQSVVVELQQIYSKMESVFGNNTAVLL